MQLKIEFTPSFLRASGKLVSKNPTLSGRLNKTISDLTENPFTPSLKSHALKGNLQGKYACSLTHSLRIVFELTDDCIALLAIGSHDEVY